MSEGFLETGSTETRLPDTGSANKENKAGFPKSARILRSSDFRKVYDNGMRYTCPFFAAFRMSQADFAGPRVGFTTPKALGKAVIRNRIRRRMREAVRLELAALGSDWSIVFNPRRKAFDCPFAELRAEVSRFFQRYLSQRSTATSV